MIRKFRPNRIGTTAKIVCFFLVLFLSGAAALVNQVVWQRSLSVFMGGSESLSAMVVVLVFMLGLGSASIWMGSRTPSLSDPLATLCKLEFLLGLVNLAIDRILQTDLSATVLDFQRLARSFGAPLWTAYALSSLLLLTVPCMFMGASAPLAAEVCQRRLRLKESRSVGLIFFANTLGSVLGALSASGYWIPNFGLSTTRVLFAAVSLGAGLMLLGLRLLLRGPQVSQSDTSPRSNVGSPARPSLHAVLAFGLGFCSLGFEMYLLRIIALRHEPLPFTFGAVVSGFLLYWSLGAAASSSRWRLPFSPALRVIALSSVAAASFSSFDPPSAIMGLGSMIWLVVSRFPYFLPCFFYGWLFGELAAEGERSWGKNVGRIYGWNMGGSCLGVVFTTLIGYEVPSLVMILFIAFTLYALNGYLRSRENEEQTGSAKTVAWLNPLLAGVVPLVVFLVLDPLNRTGTTAQYSGREGVLQIDANSNLIWNGMWHSKLAENGDQVGTNNWIVAAAPVLAHQSGQITDACVIGLSVGISASTLTRLETLVSLDAYEINRTLLKIYARYPEGTLHLNDNKKIHILWQDARSGLELSDKQYDIIQTQPLYLRQAGSGLLNSIEFYRLISRRLKPGGIFSLYSNGTAEQAFVVRQTASLVFPYRASVLNGYLLLLSNDPFRIDNETLRLKYETKDAFWDEVRQNTLTREPEMALKIFDGPEVSWGDGRMVTTDDYPIVEYPNFLSNKIFSLYGNNSLPIPLNK